MVKYLKAVKNIYFLKVEDDKAEQNMTNNGINQYAKENKVTI